MPYAEGITPESIVYTIAIENIWSYLEGIQYTYTSTTSLATIHFFQVKKHIWNHKIYLKHLFNNVSCFQMVLFDFLYKFK